MNKVLIERMYAEKRAYVEETLAAMLKPMDGFGKIEYARDVITGEEYVKVTESNGYPWFICVTGNSTGAIGSEVCTMVGHGVPTGLVRSKAAQTQVNRLFGGM